MKYTKKPVTIEAIKWDGMNSQEIKAFVGKAAKFETKVSDNGSGCSASHTELVIHTLEGNMHADFGDMIIKGVNGEFYPCKPDIFAKTYDKAPADYKDRMKVEYYELNERWNKLGGFFQTAIFGNLPFEKKVLLERQYKAMAEYRQVLEERIKLEGIVL
jgi:hypothetical protein